MKKLMIAAATAAALTAGSISVANAAPGDRYYNGAAYSYHGQNINAAQRNIDRRIDQGVRRGDITRREAVQLRAEFRQIANLEQRYRRGGLTRWERVDLDRRLDVLSRKVFFERHDANYRDRDGRYDGRRW